jgi:hypothetical protein
MANSFRMTVSNVIFGLVRGAGIRSLFHKGKLGFGFVKGKAPKNFCKNFSIDYCMLRQQQALPDAALLAVLRRALVEREGQSQWLRR